MRLEADDSVRLSEPHFCGRCSRLALSLGIAEWIFALSDGLVGDLSADYDKIAQLRWQRLPAAGTNMAGMAWPCRRYRSP